MNETIERRTVFAALTALILFLFALFAAAGTAPPAAGARASAGQGPDTPYTYYRPDSPDEQFGRDRDLTLIHQAIDLTIDMEARHIAGTTLLRMTFPRPVDRIHLDAAQMATIACRLLPASKSQPRAGCILLGADENGGSGVPAGGLSLRWRAVGDTLVVDLGQTRGPADTLVLAVEYEATPHQGLYFRDPEPGSHNRHPLAFSQGETETNRYWFPTRDFPDVQASSEVRVTVKRPYVAISNGVENAVIENDDGTRTFHWVESVPHAPYLTSLVVGVYQESTLSGDPPDGTQTPLYVYHYPGDRERALYSLRNTGAVIDLFEKLTGIPYPYERYAQVVVTRFLFSGMENIGETTLTDWTLHDPEDEPDFRSDGLLAHEAAHQWFGDLVTCRNWAHIWLNEGCATYFTWLWSEHDGTDDEAARLRLHALDHYLKGAARARRALVVHRFAPSAPPFDSAHAYHKGAFVLHLLRRTLGDDLFFAGVHRYLAENAHRAVETDDLRHALEEVSGLDLGLLFQQWVYSPGHPELAVSSEWDEEAGELAVRVEQTQTGDGRTPAVFSFPLEIGVAGGVATSPGGRSRAPIVQRVNVTRREETFHVPFTEPPRFVVVDPNGDLAAEIESDATGDELRAVLATAPWPTARARAARALLAGGPGPDDTASLAAALANDSTWWVREEAAQALGGVPGETALHALATALTGPHADADSRVRRAAADALGPHPADEAATALRSALRDDASECVRGAASAAFGTVVRARAVTAPLGEKPAVPAGDAWRELEKLTHVSSHYDTLRAGALRGLAALHDPRAVDVALAATSTGNGDHERMAAVTALGLAAGAFTEKEEPRAREKAYDRLVELLDDPFFRVRRRAIEALGDLGDPRAIPLMEAAARREVEAGFDAVVKEAVKKIRQRAAGEPAELETLGSRVDQLEKKNRDLEERVRALEKQ